MNDKIIFVYNADSGIFNGIKDIFYKIVSPKTYPCTLCMITHGNLKMRKKWKDFVSSLNQETEFLHRDEFVKKYNLKEELPAVFIQKKGKINTLINNIKMNKFTDLDDLMNLLNIKLENGKTRKS